MTDNSAVASRADDDVSKTHGEVWRSLSTPEPAGNNGVAHHGLGRTVASLVKHDTYLYFPRNPISSGRTCQRVF